MEKKDTLHFKDLSKEQRELACSIINRFGTGGHPVADEQTIDGFSVSYLKSILNKKKFIAASTNLSELGEKTLEELREKL
jgi:hypothetical protein